MLEKRIGFSVFGKTPVSQKNLEDIQKLPVEKNLGRELANMGIRPASKLREIREFLDTVGRGLPVPWNVVEEETGAIRDMVGSITVLLSLEQEGKIWIPNSQLYYVHEGNISYGGRGTISVDGREMSFPTNFRTQMNKVRRLPAKTRHVVVPVLVSHGTHANVLVLDRKKKTVSFFEPHGLYSRDRYFQGTEEFLQKFLDTFGLLGYKIKYGEATCPWFGPQAIEPQQEYSTGYCQTWTDLFVYCKMRFPDLTDAELNYALTHGLTPREVRDRVERFAAFAWEEGKKAAKKSKYYPDEPEKAHFFGTGRVQLKPKEVVKF
ncbi:hypothetical protein D1R32_gp143 [Tunisvirus fontaine2]|uniref:Uncharacterized protein n=1 Tax=Tunisvirus fontaine2 TaxID=1421067 RepID=V9SDQ9_9VIRU|nr:hypothetical protein D1R32_gp143 [Tunisvirus fontaine2]AHC54860.1 hypothetical protein TNS_ORF142 [Tunisvirus fontaine2]